MVALVAVFAAGGCSAPRTPVPAELADLAEVPWFAGYRCWGDEDGHVVRDRLARSLQLERQALGEAPEDALPDADYLALSGGGQNGAFGAGLLCGWTVSGKRPTFKIVTGISTGALIAPFAFLGPEYDGVLAEMYTTVSTRQILKRRGLLSFLLSDALADDAPLRALVERHIDERFLDRVAEEHRKGRLLIVGTTNLDAERPVIWFLGGIAASGHPDALRLFRDVLVASASLPGIFPPVMIEVEANGRHFEELHVDGGVSSQMFMYPAALDLRRLFAELHAERRRSVYVIRNGKTIPEGSVVARRALSIAERALTCLILSQSVGDLYRIYLGCQRDGFEFHYAAIPADFHHEKHEPFDTDYMRDLFEVGYHLAAQGDPWHDAPPGFETLGH
jgi:hypothetical protein